MCGLIAIVGHYVYSNLHTSDCLAALETANLRCSLTNGYDCDQSAMAERVNGILKNEFHFVFPDDLAQTRLLVDQAVYPYNEEYTHCEVKCESREGRDALFCVSSLNGIVGRCIREPFNDQTQNSASLPRSRKPLRDEYKQDCSWIT